MRVHDQLNNVGLKATAPRLKVLEVFHEHQREHLSAEDVHRRMLDRRADVGVATVYRVLGQLTDVGILSRHVFESGKAVYELHRGKHHDHLICLDCGRVDEFVDDVIEQRQRAVAQASGYALAQHQLALYGYCPDCRARLHAVRDEDENRSY
ncbi:MAG: ferric iron uptake transcriptional regulator [Polyangiales bacterium]